MDKADKIKGALKKPLKPRDALFGGAVPPSTDSAISPAQEPAKVERKHIMTIPLTEAEKFLIEDLGRKLQRNRVKQPGRQLELNWKTILRAFINVLDEDSFDGVSVKNEEEFFEWFAKNCGSVVREKGQKQ